MLDILNKRFMISDNIVEVIEVDGDRVTFLTYKKGEDIKSKGECNIVMFDIENLEKYILRD